MRDLRPLFDPRSVAVLGASGDPAKWGQWVAAGALRGAHRRDVWLVNRKGGEILGHHAFRSLDELPDAPELVVIVLPASAFEDAIEASLAAGARAIVAITAGLGELGEEGKARELAAVERVRAAGAIMLGPNCLGVYCEDFRDGRAFARAGAAAVARGKQVVLLAAGGSEAGARAAASHTGALASDAAAVDAACGAAQILRVATPKDLVDRALASLAPHRPRGRRVAIVGDGGGTGVVTADLVTEAGLELPRLSDELAAKLTEIAPSVVTTNPVDLAGAGEQDFWNFERVTSTMLGRSLSSRCSHPHGLPGRPEGPRARAQVRCGWGGARPRR